MKWNLLFTLTSLAFVLLIGAFHLTAGLCLLAVSLVVHVVIILQRPD
jgi:hypothetical protein